ncbi:TPA: hypothetical protein N0F65_005976 [Lagenidium giganteum]|uniref:PX domain-containing protein n=1 Tax=Lagenidium giganteum TaxID=4803 RepID=A0AAV2ZAA6_9STRA|nr:TPA: hypothetical protein N0F65_005976 [Lagenidium giganteum]
MKSFEDFDQFDERMRTRDPLFAKMMVTVAFAPPHKVRVFFRQDQSDRFLEKRRRELDYYMQRIMMFSDVADFQHGRGSRVLAEFLEANKYVSCKGVEEDDSQRIMTKMTQSPTNSGGSESGSTTSVGNGCRMQWKQAICEAIQDRFGESELKRFKRRVRDFRKQNDPTATASELADYVFATFDRDFAVWVMDGLPKMLKSTDKQSALKAAAAERQRPTSSQEMPVRVSTLSTTGADARLQRRHSDKEILSTVDRYAGGDRQILTEFKRSTRSLASGDMTGRAFAQYVHRTLGKDAADEVLRMVASVVPDARIQAELCSMLNSDGS